MALLDQIRAHAAEAPDEEVCGLLFGDVNMIDAAQPATNIADDRRHRFELDPATLFAAHRAARAGGPGIVGHYHSHPNGVARPSARDAADAEPGSLWLILAGPEALLFEAVEAGPIAGRFRQIEMEIRDRRVALPPRPRHKGR